MGICTKCGKRKKYFNGFRCRKCVSDYRKKFKKPLIKKCPICKELHSKPLILECSIKCRLLNRIEKINECWEWQGMLNNHGYGVIVTENKRKYAHRESYKEFIGEIPNSKCVCHTCDNPKCINPKHLWIGTREDNNKDTVKKGRHNYGINLIPAMKGEKSPNSKLKNEDIFDIRQMLEKNIKRKEIEKKYKISRGHLSMIANRQIWNHI